MSESKILHGKRAVIFGAGGSIGAAVAKEFAAEGAEVFLSGRTRSNVEAVANQIKKAGGRAHEAVVDALDDALVNTYLEAISREHGPIDVEFNAVGPLASDYRNGTQAIELGIDEFMLPVNTVLKSQFITARSAVRHMIRQGSGVIIFLTGSPARGHVEGATAIGAAFGAVETLTENLALEVGASGVRVVCLRTTANIDSRAISQTIDLLAAKANAPREQMIARMASFNFLKTPAMIRDTARMAVLLASDRGRLLTATTINSTAGAAAD